MVIENKNTITSFNMRRYIIILLYVSIIIFISFAYDLGIHWEGNTKIILIVSFTLAFLLFSFYEYFLNCTYFYFSDEEEGKLIFRYASMRIFEGKRNSIEVGKHNFYKYSIESSFFSQKRSLIIYIRTEKGVAKYPPVSISCLGRNKTVRLAGELNKYIQKTIE